MPKHLDTTSNKEIEIDVTSNNEVAERKVVEEKINEEERTEEPENKYVNKQQLHSPKAMEEQVENLDLAHAFNAIKEISENLFMMIETRKTIQEEYHHIDYNIRKDEYVPANNIIVKVTQVVSQ